MGRFALALAAIVILTLSAVPMHGHPQATTLGAGVGSAAAFQNNTDALRAELLMMKHTTTPTTALRAPNEEPPAPALLVYLALILVGSVGSVALARRRLGRES